MKTGYDTKAEEHVLNTTLKNPKSIHAIFEIVKPDDFYDVHNKRIAKIIHKLFVDGENISIASVIDRMGVTEAEARIRVANLELDGGSGRSIKIALANASVVARHATRRAAVEVANLIQREAPGSGAIEDLIEACVSKLISAKRGQGRKTAPLSPQEARARVLASFEDILSGEQKNGLETKLQGLDKLLNGLKPGNFVVLAGRPGMGKSAFLLWLLKKMSSTQCSVCLFAQEMTMEENFARLLAIETGMDSRKIRNPFELSEHDRDKVRDVLTTSKDKIYISDSTLTISELESHVISLVESDPDVKVVAIDYLQIMASQRKKGDNQTNEISERTLRLKALAKKAGVVLIALSQLSRSVETRGGDKKPVLSDLRDSGSIEQDADTVMFVYRGEYYGFTENSEGMSCENMTEIIVAKNRFGETGTAYLRHDLKTNVYQDWNEYSNLKQNDSKAFVFSEYPWLPKPLQSSIDIEDERIEF